MRLLDKYILKAFVGPFLFGVFAFTSIIIVIVIHWFVFYKLNRDQNNETI